MSFALARSYFSTIATNQGFKKHYDGFSTENIPSTVIDRAYHVEALNFTGLGNNQGLQVEASVTVRLYFKAFRDVDGAIEAATTAGETFVETALASENRLQSVIKNVVFESMTLAPLGATNDNLVVCELAFSVTFIKGIC